MKSGKYDGFSPEIFSLIPRKTKVLDLGCSTGRLAQYLLNKECKVIGVDIDKEFLKKAALYCERVIQIDLDEPDGLKHRLNNERFDVITAGDVLEHLKDPGKLISFLKSYLKKGGLFLASVPNAGFILLRLRFLLGNFSYQEMGGLMDKTHLRFFNFLTARKLFDENDYKVLKVYGKSTVKNKYFILRFLTKLMPTLFALHVIIVAKRK